MKVLARTNVGYVVDLTYTEIANLCGDSHIDAEGFMNDRHNTFTYRDLPINATINVSSMYKEARGITNSLEDMSTKMKSISTSIQNLLSGMENRLHPIEMEDEKSG